MPTPCQTTLHAWGKTKSLRESPVNSHPASDTDGLGDDPFAIPLNERLQIDQASGKRASAYGEIHPESASQLFASLALGPEDCFFDLGSGDGKLVMQVAIETQVGQSIGIELSASRHAMAERALRGHPELSRRVRLFHGDFRRCDLSRATVILAGSLCFPETLMRGLIRRALMARALRRVISFRQIPSTIDAQFREIAEIDLKTSWAHRSRAHVYSPR